MKRLWRALTEPSPAIQEPDQRRLAQLLAAFLVIVIPLAAVLEILTIALAAPAEHYTGYRVTIVALVFLTGAYGLSRTRRFRLAAFLTIAIGSASIFIGMLTEENPDVNFLYYLVVPILLGSLVLTPRQTFWLSIANITGLLLVPLVAPAVSYATLLTGPFSVLIVMVALFLLTLWYRNLLEQDRQAELARERNLLRTVIDNLPDSIYAKDLAGHFILDNLADARSMDAAAPEAVMGKTDSDFYPPELATQYRADDQAIMESRQSLINREEPGRDAAGNLRWVLTTKVPLRDAHGQVTGLVGIGRDITERKLGEAELRRQAQEMAALYETTHDLAAYHNLADLLQTIMERATLLLNASGGGIYFYDPQRQELEVTITKGMPIPAGVRLRLGEGMAGRVAQTREPLIVDDYQTWAGRARQFDALPIKAVVEVPMLYSGELIGVLTVEETGNITRRFTEADARLLALFASQAASAVHNARLFVEIHRRAEQLATIHTIGQALAETLDLPQIYERLAQATHQLLLDISALFIFRFDSDKKLLTGVYGIHDGETLDLTALPPIPLEPPGVGTQSEVVYTRRPLIVGDLPARLKTVEVCLPVGQPDSESPSERSKTQSGLYVPLLTKNSVIGVLQVESYALNRFRPADAELLEAVANMAAIAIENASLYSQNFEQLENLSALHVTSQKLSYSLSVQTLAEDATRTCVEFFGAELAWLGYAQPDGTVRLLTHFPAQVEYPRQIQVRWDDSPEGQGPGGQAIRTGFPVVTADVNNDPNFGPWQKAAQAQGFQTVGAFPLISRNHTFGLLAIYSRQADFFTSKRVGMLQTYAHQAAAALSNARLFEETERRLQYLKALRSIDLAINSSLDLRITLNVILDEVTTQLKVDAADVLLHNSQMLNYAAGRGFRASAAPVTRQRLGEGPAGRAALERRLITILDFGQWIKEETASIHNLQSEGFVFYCAAPLIAKGEIKGVLEIFHRAPLIPDQEWLDFVEALAGQAAIAVDNVTLFDGLQRSNTELILAYDSTIEGWSRALDLRDKETEGHTQRVTEMTMRLAQASGAFSNAELTHLRRGALLHDIGKMGVPDGILLKPGELTKEEWGLMRQHPQYAYDMLLPIAFLRPALDIPYCHHEKWDGTGYPRGLKGEQIPLTARLFAIVDVWDALRSDRPYRAAWPEVKVYEHIRSLAGTHFDPQVVETFLKLMAGG